MDQVQQAAPSPGEPGEILHSNRFADAAPAQDLATPFNEGIYPADQVMFYPGCVLPAPALSERGGARAPDATLREVVPGLVEFEWRSPA
jgi:hypothetical protein